MNRLVITNAKPGACPVCADIGQLRVDVGAYKIVGVVDCPMCRCRDQLDGFVEPLMDYLKRPTAPRPVTS